MLKQVEGNNDIPFEATEVIGVSNGWVALRIGIDQLWFSKQGTEHQWIENEVQGEASYFFANDDCCIVGNEYQLLYVSCAG